MRMLTILAAAGALTGLACERTANLPPEPETVASRCADPLTGAADTELSEEREPFPAEFSPRAEGSITATPISTPQIVIPPPVDPDLAYGPSEDPPLQDTEPIPVRKNFGPEFAAGDSVF